jgi:hypothetical protein
MVGSDMFVKQWNDFSAAADKHASNATEADQPAPGAFHESFTRTHLRKKDS